MIHCIGQCGFCLGQCGFCMGECEPDPGNVKCPACDGRGYAGDSMEEDDPCNRCSGSGEIVAQPCGEDL